MTKPIRLLITDDHAIVRKGIHALINTVQDIILVGEAENGQQALEMCTSLKPDIVLMDLVMPVMNGIEAILEIKKICPDMPILVLTSFSGDDKVFPAIKAGAMGYLLKDSAPEELMEAIYQVVRGEPSLHPTIAQKLLHELMNMDEDDSKEQRRKNQFNIPGQAESLTDREVEILKLVARGLSNRQISEQLIISEATVRSHVSNILAKLHLASRTQAVLYALREGLATLNEGHETESLESILE
ncbi:MAG: response regulator transcription factor [Anaerolineaceae bacterium]|nr:response regulator transcription factor [Anaerolineaceae bacterium]